MKVFDFLVCTSLYSNFPLIFNTFLIRIPSKKYLKKISSRFSFRAFFLVFYLLVWLFVIDYL